MLISGGVDSSVALRLLKDEGHDITAFYLKIWLEDELAYLGECPWEEDLKYVEEVCKQADVPLEVVPLQREYWDRVVSYTIAEAKAGRTPNPDIFCNQRVKFGAFFDRIDDSFEKVATGHYARVGEFPMSNFQYPNESDSSASLGMTDSGYVLKMAPDGIKDQTYFLSHISQQQLSRLLFPIGHLKKSEVRELAEKYELPNRHRKDSQGICFLGKVPFREFLKHHLDEKPGDFIEQATGKVVGQHLGYWFYTVGQRKGLNLSGGPWFVVGKDIEKNRVYLANGYEPEEVYRDEFEVGTVHFINDQFSIEEFSVLSDQLSVKSDQSAKLKTNLFVKIRHGATMHPCHLETLENGGYKVFLENKVHGVAPGQFGVFYWQLSDEETICLGGGMIVE